MKSNLLNRSLVEAFGTASLAFVCIKSSFIASSKIEEALLTGLVITSLIHCFGRLSGAHFNPLISILLKKKEKNFDFQTFFYIASQTSSAIIIYLFNSDLSSLGIEKNYNFSPLMFNHIFSEFLLSSFLMILIISWATEGKLCPFSQPFTGIVMGLGITTLLSISSLNGVAALNPAISIASALQGNNPDLLNQLIGQFLALILCKKIL
tara:strand:+ start:445 stop:1068 length:624 start_codon:yes stop_codon:yes gene_type:complete